MDLKQLKGVMKDDSEGGFTKKKDIIVYTSMEGASDHEIHSSAALQQFLDRIPVSSIPGISNSPVVELNSDDCLKDAIRFLYERNVSGAPIKDVVAARDQKFVDRHIGFIDFYSMVLWCIEECDKANAETKHSGCNGFFSMMEQISHIGGTKIGDLAKFFLWDPFFPVHSDDTLFHVLLLFTKHPLKVLPVVERNASLVTGFITMNAVVQLLHQSSGLEWFDRIADKSLSEFGITNNCPFVYIHGDQSIADALNCLRENRIDVVPVVDRKTKTLIGNVTKNDILLLLEDNDLFINRKSLTINQFINVDARRSNQRSDASEEGHLGALLSAGILRLKGGFLQSVDPVMNCSSDTLKQAMEKLMTARSSQSVIVDGSKHVTGVVTLRDVIMHFSPPSMDSRINGGGFFEFALEQTGCRV